ncbi:MAG: acyltransferase family protein [Legionella sp.]|nr:acyltransferase family protein [Legionella sp.]
MSSIQTKYRADIDGLRAIAVIAVMLFHAGFPLFSGGFVGVDIFFVISGFLITFIIISEKQTGHFSFYRFYERRARRILPALFVIMFACIIFAFSPPSWLGLDPLEMLDLSKSLMAVSTFSSNLLFWKQTGYFDAAAEFKPLLHTWSLSVEEQYYLLFPLFLILTWKIGRRLLIPALIGIAIISLCISQWGALHMPAATFFLLPTRIWELFIGVLVAFYFFAQKPPEASVRRNLLGILGILFILYAIFFFDKETPFPSFYGLLPTVGAALIILCTDPDSIVGKTLGSRLLASLGLVSYSTYLWHQLLFAFFRIHNLGDLSALQSCCLILISFVLGYFSWKFIETPFRDKQKWTTPTFWIIAGLCSALFFFMGYEGYTSNGFEKKYLNSLSQEQRKIYDYKDYSFNALWKRGSCFLTDQQTYHDFKSECQATTKEENDLLVWGDSYAASFSVGLRTFSPNLIQYTSSACPPIVDKNFIGRPECLDINKFILSEVKRLKPKRIILQGSWVSYSENVDIKAIQQTILAIQSVSPNSKITLIGSLPVWKPTLPSLMIRKNLPLEKDIFINLATYNTLAAIDASLHNIAKNNHIDFFSPLEHLCQGPSCRITVKTPEGFSLMTFDYAHLTESGSKLLAAQFNH